MEERECKTCKNPYCLRPIEERQKQEVQHHFQYGWECSDKEKYLQDDGGFVLVKKERITDLDKENAELKEQNKWLEGCKSELAEHLEKANDKIAKLDKENTELKETLKTYNGCGDWDDDFHMCRVYLQHEELQMYIDQIEKMKCCENCQTVRDANGNCYLYKVGKCNPKDKTKWEMKKNDR